MNYAIVPRRRLHCETGPQIGRGNPHPFNDNLQLNVKSTDSRVEKCSGIFLLGMTQLIGLFVFFVVFFVVSFGHFLKYSHRIILRRAAETVFLQYDRSRDIINKLHLSILQYRMTYADLLFC